MNKEFIITDRQAEILAKVASGMSYEEVGDSIYLSRHTISSHMQKVLSNTGTKSSVQAVAQAVALGKLVLCENGEFTAV